jgi:hypothetical protein
MATSIVNLVAPPAVLSGSYNKQDFRTSTMGTSDCNMFIPFYAMFFHDLITFKDKDVRVVEYTLPIDASGYSFDRKYDQLIFQLINATTPRRFCYILQGVNHYVNIHRGVLYDSRGNILMCLGINTEYLLNNPLSVIASSPDYSKFVLLLGSELNNPIYKNLKKKLGETYISDAVSLGMDVVNTSKINSWLFKNNYVEPKFKNVTEMKKFLKEEVPKSLLID